MTDKRKILTITIELELLGPKVDPDRLDAVCEKTVHSAVSAVREELPKTILDQVDFWMSWNRRLYGMSEQVVGTYIEAL